MYNNNRDDKAHIVECESQEIVPDKCDMAATVTAGMERGRTCTYRFSSPTTSTSSAVRSLAYELRRSVIIITTSES